MSFVTICRSCRAKILYIETVSGKKMPCNAEPVLYKETGEGNDKVITPEGVLISCDLVTDPNEADGLGYVPHWGTCNAPDKFRKKGAKTC